MSKKEEIFTDEMGKHIFVFPPTKKEDSTARNQKYKKSNLRRKMYGGIPLKMLEGTYRRTYGKKRNISFGE